MFSISFGEMMVIIVMGLIVVGPERLPAAAKFMGHLFGRIQRQMSSVKRDIKREMDLAELRDMQNSYKQTADELSRSMQSPVTEMKENLESLSNSVEESAQKTNQPEKHKSETAVPD